MSSGSVPPRSNIWSNIFKTAPEKEELISILRAIPPFSELSRHGMHELIKAVHNRTYARGEHIFYQGDPGIALYIITEGTVDIVYETGRKEKVTMASFSKGDFFGELALLDGDQRSASAIAVTECKASVIFKNDLDELIKKYPTQGVQILAGIAKIIVTRLRHMNTEYLALYDHFSAQDGTDGKTSYKKDTHTG